MAKAPNWRLPVEILMVNGKNKAPAAMFDRIEEITLKCDLRFSIIWKVLQTFDTIMQEITMSEDREGVPQTTKESGRWSFKNILSRFSNKGDTKLASSAPEIPAQEFPPADTSEVKDEVSTVDTSEVDEEIKVENSDDESMPESTSEETKIPEKEKLRPVNRIFFHTTPTRNLPSIIRRGLLGEKGHPSVGRELMYSLAFPEEFNEINVGRPIVRKEGQISDFVMTIWKANPEIKQNRDRYEDKFYGEYSPVGSMNEEEDIPDTYLNSGGGYYWKINPEVEKENFRKVDSSNYLAAVPLTEENQIFIAECMLKFYKVLSSAQDLEGKMVEYFQNPTTNLVLNPNYLLSDFAHDLMGRIQQEVVLASAKIAAKKAEDLIKAFDISDKYR